MYNTIEEAIAHVTTAWYDVEADFGANMADEMIPDLVRDTAADLVANGKPEIAEELALRYGIEVDIHFPKRKPIWED